jgi:hypothetical protein
MHVWVNWQHLEVDADLVGNGTHTLEFQKVNQDFHDLDMFMAGGVIFF